MFLALIPLYIDCMIGKEKAILSIVAYVSERNDDVVSDSKP